MEADSITYLSLPPEMRAEIYTYLGEHTSDIRLVRSTEKELVDCDPQLKFLLFQKKVYQTLIAQKEQLRENQQWSLLKKITRIEAAKNFHAALEFVETIKNSEKKNEMIAQLAAYRIHTDEKAALSLVKRLDKRHQEFAYSLLAKEVAEKNESLATSLASKIKNPRIRLNTCIKVSEIQGKKCGVTEQLLNDLEKKWSEENESIKETLAYTYQSDRLVSARLMTRAVEASESDPENSLEIAKEIPTISLTYPARHLIVAKLAKTNLDSAKGIADEIRDKKYKDKAYLAIVREEVKESWDGALATMNKIQNCSIQGKAYGALAFHKAKINVDEAKEFIQSLPDKTMKIAALTALYNRFHSVK